MAGRFVKDVMLADNVNFTGTTKTSQIIADGQLLIGSTARPNIAVGHLIGGDNISVVNGSGSITIGFEGPLSVEDGGTGAASFTDGGILLGSGTDPITATAQPTNGQLLIGNTGTDPVLNTLTGTEHVSVVNTPGNITLDLTSNVDATAVHSWNGAIIESPVITVTSDGATITFSVEQSGGGNLTLVFSDEFTTFASSPAATISLTAGTDTVPVLNYVYILQSTKALTVSISSFPSAEHVPLATIFCQSAASTQTDGCYKCHAWTDHTVDANEQGHIAHLNAWIRAQQATWVSGVGQTFTITPNGGAVDNVILTTAAGVVLQLHDHTFPAFSGTPDVYTVNDNATAFNKVTDLSSLLTDSTGASMSGKFFSLVFMGIVSEAEADCKMMVNLPSGSYNNAASVTLDSNKYANFTIPADFVGTAFLHSQWNLRHQSASGGTWTSVQEIDLRGLLPAITAGGSTASPSEFTDDVFRILDDGDNTKEIAFEASGITTATTRTFTVPNASGTIALASGLAANGFAYALDGNTIDSTAAATNGQLLVGSTSAVPVAASLTAPAAGITITGGAGSVTFALADDLSALEGLGSTGLAARTAANTWAQRTLTSASSSLVVTDGNGVSGNPTLTLTNDLVVQGRLTLTTGTPVTTTDVSAAATLYFTPYKGDRITLFTSSVWEQFVFTEMSISVPAVATQVYDVFVYDNSGTPTMELLAWTNDTTRATALTTQNGVLAKTGDTSRLYVGTVRTISASELNNTVAFRHVWNYYNRIRTNGLVQEATDSWTYTTATFRQANANTANQLDFVTGVSEDMIEAQIYALGNNASSAGRNVSVGVDSTTVGSSNIIMGAASASSTETVTATYSGYPGVGRHILVWLEFSTATGTCTWFGDAGGPTNWQSGIQGTFFI